MNVNPYQSPGHWANSVAPPPSPRNRWLRVTVVIWNLLVALCTIPYATAIGWVAVRRVYDQFTHPLADSLMWPHTFAVWFMLLCVLVFGATFSCLFNHSRRKLLRISAAVTIALISVGWVVNGWLECLMFRNVALKPVLLAMSSFMGAGYAVIDIFLLSVAVWIGRGPLSLLAAAYRRLWTRYDRSATASESSEKQSDWRDDVNGRSHRSAADGPWKAGQARPRRSL